MIRNHDRSGWFGASDTATIMGNWDTLTFRRFWLTKLGLRRDHFESLAMRTGTVLEHRILEYLGIACMDRQIKVRAYRLRVNLDGEVFSGKARKNQPSYLPQANKGDIAALAEYRDSGHQNGCCVQPGNHGYIVEVKTHSAPVFRLTKAYWQQAQVECFAAKKPVQIAAYRVTQEDYRNWFLPIDPDRLTLHPVEYDPEWIETQYLPRLRYLAGCLRKGAWPDADAV